MTILTELSPEKLRIALNTISPYAFYFLVGDALARSEGLSVVRMGDGERTLYQACAKARSEERHHQAVSEFTPEWRTRMGIEGISYHELHERMNYAATQCTYFGPNIHGLTLPAYDVYEWARPNGFYVDNFFVNVWNDEYKEAVIRAAGGVIFIHRNRNTADAMQIRLKKYFGIWTDYVEMSNWSQADAVVEKCKVLKGRLVLFAGGPANKMIAPKLAAQGRVVLDIGNTADYWTFQRRYFTDLDAEEQAEKKRVRILPDLGLA